MHSNNTSGNQLATWALTYGNYGSIGTPTVQALYQEYQTGRRPMITAPVVKEPKPETNLDWLTKRVDEIRVKL